MGKLYRSDNKVFGGVCAGLAESLRWNVYTLRTLFLVLAILTHGAMCIFYVILWCIMPNKKSRKNYVERMRDKLGK